MKVRTFNIMQYEKHPVTGEPLLNEESIKEGVNHKSINDWAYICHDKDVYTEKDIEDYLKRNSDKDKKEEEVPFKVGDTKPRHWHIVLKCKNAVELSVISKWFGIPENFIDVPKGHGAFLDCVEYLTHEREEQQRAGKRLYEDSEVKASFDFRDALDKRAENKLKYKKDLDEKQELRKNVMYEGWNLLQCEKYDPIGYMEDMDRIKKLRLDYLQNRAPLPPLRINYYIDGDGGIGKNTAARALAKTLFPDYEGDCFFEVGAENVSFEGYDGQPVIIWNDRRAAGFISTFGREETFDIFDSHPTNARHNVKYGSVRLVNAVNIVNGVEDYQVFLDGLAGEYTAKNGTEYKAEDKSQSYRRFPIILCLRENDFDILLNKGVAEGTREYQQYIGYQQMVGSFARLSQKLAGEAKEIVVKNLMTGVTEFTEIIKKNDADKISKVEDLPDEFKGYGKLLESEEVKQIKKEQKQLDKNIKNFQAVIPFHDAVRNGTMTEEGFKKQCSYYLKQLGCKTVEDFEKKREEYADYDNEQIFA